MRVKVKSKQKLNKEGYVMKNSMKRKQMRSAVIILIAIVGLQLISFNTDAQLDKEVVVRKLKQWEMTEAFKINLTPEIFDTASYKPSFDYKIVPYQFKTEFKPEPIKPARMLPEPLSRHYGNYVMFGFGSDISPQAEIKINGTSKKKMAWGADLKHHSSHGKFKINDLEYYPNFNTSSAALFMNKHLKKNRIFDARIDLSSNGFKYYGYDIENEIAPLTKDSLTKQNFTLISGGIGLASNYITKSKIKYDFDLDYYLLMDKEESREQALILTAGLRDRFKSSIIGIDGSFGYYNNKFVADTFSNIYLMINPWVQRKGEDWKFIIGVNSYVKIDPDANSESYFYPNIQFEYDLADKFLQSYFGFTGHLEKNFFGELIEENPFVWSGFEASPTSVKKNIYAGFKGILTSKIKYNVKACYQEVKDAVLYVGVQDPTLFSGYRFMAEQHDLDKASVFGEIAYQGNEKFEIHLSGSYYHYFTIKNEEYAYHMPDFDLSLRAAYNIQKKIWITADLLVTGSRTAKIIEYTTLANTDINAVVTPDYLDLPVSSDLNLGVEYRYNKKVSGFLKVNNVLGSEYYNFNYYPAQRFHVTAGVIYAF